MADKSLGVFYKGFDDYKKKVKEIFLDFNMALLIPSIGAPEEIAIVVAEGAAKYVVKVQVIGTSVDNPHPTTSEVATVAEAPEAAVNT